jgi:hypothetical protein
MEPVLIFKECLVASLGVPFMSEGRRAKVSFSLRRGGEASVPSYSKRGHGTDVHHLPTRLSVVWRLPPHVVHHFEDRARPLCISDLLADGLELIRWLQSEGGPLSQVTSFDVTFIYVLCRGAHSDGPRRA